MYSWLQHVKHNCKRSNAALLFSLQFIFAASACWCSTAVLIDEVNHVILLSIAIIWDDWSILAWHKHDSRKARHLQHSTQLRCWTGNQAKEVNYANNLEKKQHTLHACAIQIKSGGQLCAKTAPIQCAVKRWEHLALAFKLLQPAQYATYCLKQQAQHTANFELGTSLAVASILATVTVLFSVKASPT